MLHPVGHVTHVVLLQIYQTECLICMVENLQCFFDTCLMTLILSNTCLMTLILSNTMFEFHGGVLAMFLLTTCKDDDIQDKTWYNLDTKYYKAALIISHKARVSAFESPEQTQFTCQ